MYRFAQALRSENAYLFERGSSALYALLKAMGVGRGDEVIAPIFTCPAVSWPIVLLGAKPVYVDIDPRTYNLDPELVREAVTPHTKVIVAQHTFGIPAEMDSIVEIAGSNGLRVIEDACHAFGSRYKGQEVGTFGHAAIYSFGWYKPLVLGTGGAAVVNDPDLRPLMEENYARSGTPSMKGLIPLYAQYLAMSLLFTPSRFWSMKEVYRRIRDFRQGPRKGKLAPLLFGHESGPSSNDQDRTVGEGGEAFDESESFSGLIALGHLDAGDQLDGKFDRRIAPFQAERLGRKLAGWESIDEQNRWVVSQYERLLPQAGYSNLELEPHLEPVLYKYPVRSEHKAEIFNRARVERVEISDMFGSPLYPPERRANWEALGYREGTCPLSEQASAEIIALPVHYKIKQDDIERTMKLLHKFSRTSGKVRK